MIEETHRKMASDEMSSNELAKRITTMK